MTDQDHVDQVRAEWKRERPDLDTSPIAVVARLGRAARYLDAGLEKVFGRYGLSRGRVHQLTRQRHFPRPVQGEGTSHPMWLAIDVEQYRSEPPPVGRPPKGSDGNSA